MKSGRLRRVLLGRLWDIGVVFSQPLEHPRFRLRDVRERGVRMGRRGEPLHDAPRRSSTKRRLASEESVLSAAVLRGVLGEEPSTTLSARWGLASPGLVGEPPRHVNL